MLDFATATNLRSDARPSTPFALRDLLNGIFYYRRIAAIVFGVVLAIGVVVAVALPPTYRAEAQLLPLSAGIYDMQDAGRTPQPGQVLDPAAVVNVELQMLDSLELHRAVVRGQMGPSASTAQIDKALDRFETNLHVTKANEANVIELTYAARDPQVAADALRDLIARYFDSRANVLTAGRVTFLEGQRDKVKIQLDRANADIARYSQANGIVDITAQVAGAVAQDDLLHKNKLDTQAQLADGRKSLTTLESESRSVPSQIELYSDNTEAARALGEMQSSLLQLQAKRADLASRYMTGSPQVAQVDRQIVAVQNTIRQQRSALVTTKRTGRNQFYDSTRDRLTQAQATVSGAAARSGELAAQIAASGARLTSLTGIADRLAAMKLDRDVLADTFKSLSVQVEQARVQLNQTTSAGSPSVRIIEAPTPARQAQQPAGAADRGQPRRRVADRGNDDLHPVEPARKPSCRHRRWNARWACRYCARRSIPAPPVPPRAISGGWSRRSIRSVGDPRYRCCCSRPIRAPTCRTPRWGSAARSSGGRQDRSR